MADPDAAYCIAMARRLRAWLAEDLAAHPVDEIERNSSMLSSMATVVAETIVEAAGTSDGAMTGAHLFGHCVVDLTARHWNEQVRVGRLH